MSFELFKAVESDSVDAIRIDLTVKSVINDPISIYNSQQFCLSRAKNSEIATLLLSNGANVGSIQKFKKQCASKISGRIRDPLNIYISNPSFAKVLLDSYGASVDVNSIPELHKVRRLRSLIPTCNPLIYAVLTRELPTLQLFLQYAVCVYKKSFHLFIKSERRYFIGALSFAISYNLFNYVELIFNVFSSKFHLELDDLSYFWKATVYPINMQIHKWLDKKTRELNCWTKYSENIVTGYKDIFNLIMSYLSQHDILKMTQVCKSWMHTCKQCFVNEIDAKQEYSVLSFLHKFPLARHVTIPGNYLYYIQDWLHTLSSLTCTNIILELPTRQYDCLQSLTVETLFEMSVNDIYLAFPNLKHLIITRSTNKYIPESIVDSFLWPHLKTLSIKHNIPSNFHRCIEIHSTELQSLTLTALSFYAQKTIKIIAPHISKTLEEFKTNIELDFEELLQCHLKKLYSYRSGSHKVNDTLCNTLEGLVYGNHKLEISYILDRVSKNFKVLVSENSMPIVHDALYQLQSLTLNYIEFAFQRLSMNRFTSLTYLCIYNVYTLTHILGMVNAIEQIPNLKTLAIISNYWHQLPLDFTQFKMSTIKELILIGHILPIGELNLDNLEYLVMHSRINEVYTLDGTVLNSLKWFDFKNVQVSPLVGEYRPYLGPKEISEVVL